MYPRQLIADLLPSVAAIILSVFALSLGDAIIKMAGVNLPLWQMYLLRSAIVVPVLAVIILRRSKLSIHSWWWVSVRSLLLVTMWLCYYSALPKMPLSLAAAIYYTAPVFIVILSAFIERRAPSPIRLIAVAMGFSGVIAILRPDGGDVGIAALLPLSAAVLYASAMLLTSYKCRNESTLVLALSLNIAMLLAGALLGLLPSQEGSFLLGFWQTPNLELVLIITMLAACILVGSIGAAYAYQFGPPPVIAAFDYAYLAFSLLWGTVFFDEIPDAVGLVGIMLICVAGFLATRPSKG